MRYQFVVPVASGGRPPHAARVPGVPAGAGFARSGFVPVAGFAVGDAVPFGLFADRCNFSLRLADVLSPVAVGAFGAPGFAWPLICLVAVDTFCPG